MSTPPGSPPPHIIRQLSESFRMGEWVLDAACGRHPDPDVFFPENGRISAHAKVICLNCTVQKRCRDYVLSSPRKEHGIWGGMKEEDIEAERSKRTIPVWFNDDACGTPAGIKRHERAGVPACPPCRKAAAKARLEARRKKKEEAS